MNEMISQTGSMMEEMWKKVDPTTNCMQNFQQQYSPRFSPQNFAGALLAGSQGMEFNFDDPYSNFPDIKIEKDPYDFVPSPTNSESYYCFNKHPFWSENSDNQPSVVSNMPNQNFLETIMQQEEFMKIMNQERESQEIFQMDQAINKQLQQQMLYDLMKQREMYLPQRANSVSSSAPPSPSSSYSGSISSPVHIPNYPSMQSPNDSYSSAPSPQQASWANLGSPVQGNFPTSMPHSNQLNLAHNIPLTQHCTNNVESQPSNTEDDDIDCLDEEMLINTFKTLAEFVSNEDIKTPVRPKEKPKPKRKRVRKGTGNPAGKPRLYNFLREILDDPSRYNCIEWVDKTAGLFKFLDSAQVARLWGFRKNKPMMKYENFARSLRTYIAKGILTKPRNKLVYCFAKPLLTKLVKE